MTMNNIYISYKAFIQQDIVILLYAYTKVNLEYWKFSLVCSSVPLKLARYTTRTPSGVDRSRSYERVLERYTILCGRSLVLLLNTLNTVILIIDSGP